jgi:hypothetical protein
MIDAVERLFEAMKSLSDFVDSPSLVATNSLIDAIIQWRDAHDALDPLTWYAGVDSERKTAYTQLRSYLWLAMPAISLIYLIHADVRTRNPHIGSLASVALPDLQTRGQGVLPHEHSPANGYDPRGWWPLELGVASSIDSALRPRICEDQLAEFLSAALQLHPAIITDPSRRLWSILQRGSTWLGLDRVAVQERLDLLGRLSDVFYDSSLYPMTYDAPTPAEIRNLRRRGELLEYVGNTGKKVYPKFQFENYHSQSSVSRRSVRAILGKIRRKGSRTALKKPQISVWFGWAVKTGGIDKKEIEKRLVQLKAIAPRPSRASVAPTGRTACNLQDNIPYYRCSERGYSSVLHFAEGQGRFDLHGDWGTLYLGEGVVGCISEVLDEQPALGLQSVLKYGMAKVKSTRCAGLRFDPLDKRALGSHMDRIASQQYAENVKDASLHGVRYRLRTNPVEFGYALFSALVPKPSGGYADPPSTGVPGGPWTEDFPDKCLLEDPHMNAYLTLRNQRAALTRSAMGPPTNIALSLLCRFPDDVKFADP